MSKFYDDRLLDDLKPLNLVVGGRDSGKSYRFNQLMDIQKIDEQIRFHRVQKETLEHNYNVLQDYYNQQLSGMNYTMINMRYDDVMKKHIEAQILEVKDESNKQFEFVATELNKHKLWLIYWGHRLDVLTKKEMYGMKYKFLLYDKKDVNALPLYSFDNALEFEEWLYKTDKNISNICLDILKR